MEECAAPSDIGSVITNPHFACEESRRCDRLQASRREAALTQRELVERPPRWLNMAPARAEWLMSPREVSIRDTSNLCSAIIGFRRRKGQSWMRDFVVA